MLEDINPQEIRSIIHNIRSCTKSEQYWRLQYNQFAEDYPKLFNAAINNQFSLRYIELMLTQLEAK